jgi:Leucine-rich repeat (LRR) protein
VGLSLQSATVTPIASLAGLKQLGSLTLWNLPLGAVPVLSPRAPLIAVSVLGCGLTSLPPLAAYNLTALYLDGNRLTSLPSLALPATLTTLSANDNPIAELDLRHCTALLELDCRRCALRAMPLLPPSVASVFLSENAIADAPAGVELPSLTQISLRGNHLASVTFLAASSQLANVALGGNRIRELPPSVGAWTRVLSLKLDSNQLADVGALCSLPRLATLWLFANPALRSFGCPQDAQLGSLTELLLSNCSLSAVRIGNWPLLANLDISSNALSSIDLSRLVSLQRINAR